MLSNHCVSISLPSLARRNTICRLAAMHASDSSAADRHASDLKSDVWDSLRLEQYMEARDWRGVEDYYKEVVNGAGAFDEIGCEMPVTRWPHEADKMPPGCKKPPRITYQVCIAYFGPEFQGFARQPNDIRTVEGCLLDALRSLIPPYCPRSSISSAGRTDKGVSALCQSFSFHTRVELSDEDLKEAIENQAPGYIRVISVTRRSRSFHATFAAQWRRYIYLMPLITDDPMDIDLVNAMLDRLVGNKLNYTSLARDTPPGKDCECLLSLAKAKRVHLRGSPVLCIELIADRFLRRMVRNLVSTLVVLGSTGGKGQSRVNSEFRDQTIIPSQHVSHDLNAEPEDTLLNLILSQDRDMTSRAPAPALGLIFAGVGYS